MLKFIYLVGSGLFKRCIHILAFSGYKYIKPTDADYMIGEYRFTHFLDGIRAIWKEDDKTSRVEQRVTGVNLNHTHNRILQPHLTCPKEQPFWKQALFGLEAIWALLHWMLLDASCSWKILVQFLASTGEEFRVGQQGPLNFVHVNIIRTNPRVV